MADVIWLMNHAPENGDPRYSDWVDALEAYVNADKEREKAARQLDKAEAVVRQREAELEAVVLGVSTASERADTLDAMVADLIEQEQRGVQSVAGACPDGGTCHHGCNLSRPKPACWRVRYAGPLSGVFPGDRWPADVAAANEQEGSA